MVMKQTDIYRVRNSVGNKLGSKVMIKANKGRHKIDVTQGIIKAAYPSIFTVEVEGNGTDAPRMLSFSYTDVLTQDVQMKLC